MKILMISPIYPKPGAATQGIYVHRIYQLYRQLGYEVDLLIYESGSSKVQKLKAQFRFLTEISRRLRRGDYDIVNVQYPFLAAIPFRFIRSRAPIITSVHGYDVKYNTAFKRATGYFTRHLIKKSQMVITPSEYFKAELLRRFSIDPDRVSVCHPGGIDLEVFHPALRPEELKNPDIRRIGYCGRIVEGKGWQVLLEAFLTIAREERFRDLNLVFAGTGADDDRLLSKIQGIPDAAVRNRVQVLGALNSEELAKFYRSLDVFVFPTSYDESLGLVGIESLACGTPVIASALGGIREYLVEGVNGFLIPSLNPQALAQALDRYLILPAQEQALYKFSAARSVERYGTKNVAEKLDQLVKSLVTEKQRS